MIKCELSAREMDLLLCGLANRFDRKSIALANESLYKEAMALHRKLIKAGKDAEITSDDWEALFNGWNSNEPELTFWRRLEVLWLKLTRKGHVTTVIQKE